MFPSEPHFVSVYEIGRFAYFFLRETAVENDCGKMVFSRVARVCKNDMGGRFLLEDTWTTFMKARLNCSRSGEIPFYYNELQSTFYLPEQDLIYGIFTTNVWVMLSIALKQSFSLWSLIYAPFTNENIYIHLKWFISNCPHTSICLSCWHRCWAIHPPVAAQSGEFFDNSFLITNMATKDLINVD